MPRPMFRMKLKYHDAIRRTAYLYCEHISPREKNQQAVCPECDVMIGDLIDIFTEATNLIPMPRLETEAPLLDGGVQQGPLG